MICHMTKLHPDKKTVDWKTTPDNEDLKDIIDAELDFEPFDFTETEISGVKTYIKHLPYAPCIHMRIGFRYGAMHDEKGREGIAHFLEHMLFDGSSLFKDEKETQEFGKVIMLDTFNAHTSLFELFITGKCLPHNFDTALDGIFSMIISPKLTEASFEHEKKVITQEAWGVFLNQKRIDYIKKERENSMSDLPDRKRIASALGWPETIEQITHEDIKNAHKKYFVKENMEMYFAGNIEAVASQNGQSDMNLFLSKLDQYLSKIPNGEAALLPYIPSQISSPKINKFDHTYTEIGLTDRQQASISISSNMARVDKESGQKNTVEENKLSAITELAENLIADIVYRKLRLENSWCYGAGASVQPHADFINFSIGGTINFNHVDEAIGIIWNIIKDIENGEYRADFAKTKRLAVENTLARERTTDRILDTACESIRINNEISTLKSTLLDIADVTYEEVQDVIAKYFSEERVFTEIVRPS